MYKTATGKYFITMLGAIQTHLHKNTAMQRFLNFFSRLFELCKKERGREREMYNRYKMNSMEMGRGGADGKTIS
jgi:hypothetical protein